MASLDQGVVVAQHYIKEKMIEDLFAHLATTMIYTQPEDPKKFLLEELQRMKQDHSHKPYFFDSKDLTTMFHMFDITGRGFISTEQYQQALVNLGCGSVDTSHLKKGGQVSMDQFIKEVSPLVTLRIPQ